MTQPGITTDRMPHLPTADLYRDISVREAEPGAFASLMRETRTHLDEHPELAHPPVAAGAFGEGFKRHQRHVFREPPGRLGESVNSVGIPSEKRQDPGSTDFSQKENNERSFSGQSSAFDHSSSDREQKLLAQRHLTHCNDEIISIHASTSAPSQMNTASIAAGALLLPESEFRKLVRVLRTSSLSKRTSVFLTLDLKDMGEVKLDVRLEGKKVFITAHIRDRRAAAALSYAIGELKKKMAEIDLSLENFEFSAGNKIPDVTLPQSSAQNVVRVHAGGCR